MPIDAMPIDAMPIDAIPVPHGSRQKQTSVVDDIFQQLTTAATVHALVPSSLPDIEPI